MNAMYFIGRDNGGCDRYWWLRHGTSENHTSQSVIANLAASLENRNKEVNTWLYWDAGHCDLEMCDRFVTVSFPIYPSGLLPNIILTIRNS